MISPLLSPPANLTFSSASHTDPLNTQEIALSALTGGRGVLCVYVLRSRTLQALAPGAMVAIGAEADWAKSVLHHYIASAPSGLLSSFFR